MRFRSIIGTAFAAATLVLTGVVTTAGPASAASLPCGTTITTNTTLTGNVGPCTTTDGLIVTASNIKLNLNGYRVFAKNTPVTNRNATAGDQAGIHLVNVSNVTVTTGTVQYFDAGVLIEGGSGNTVQNVFVRDNINDFLGAPCELGDGVAMLHSDNNKVLNNRVFRNGPFGGVSIIEDSDSNLVKSNDIQDSNIVGSGCGNSNQDEGARIEGPDANFNHVESNNIVRSLLAGISLHGNVGCGQQNNPPGPDDDPANTDNFIQNNTVRATGGNAAANGIAALAQGPFGSVVCASFRNTITGNTSSGNQGDGIFIPGTSTDNVISNNIVNSNGRTADGTGDGIYLGPPVFENAFTNVGPSLLDLVQPDQPPFVQCTATPCPAGTQYFVLPGSGSGDVTAPLVPVGPINVTQPIPPDSVQSGCSTSDFAGFPVGAVALLQRGFCGRAQKVSNAVAAGASAVILFNEGSSGRTGVLTLDAGVQPVPVIGTSFAVGQQLYNLTQQGPVTIHVVTNTTNVSTQIAPGAENNTLNANRGTGNVEHDGHDDNFSPPCDNNHWTANIFGTVNQPCVKAGGGTGVVKP